MYAKVGQVAPAFTAFVARASDKPAMAPQPVSLADYQGRWLIFFWYPADFTFVCPTEIIAFSDRLDEFHDVDCDVLGASCDSIWAHRAWLRTSQSEQGIAGVKYPLLSDPTRQIASDYGVLVESEGVALRGLFIIDPDGVLQYATLNNMNVGRSIDETLRVLYAVQSGGLCPSDWKPGQALLTGE